MASVLLDDDFLTLLELDFAFDELDFATLDDEDALVEDDDFATPLELDSAFDELDFATLDDEDALVEDDDFATLLLDRFSISVEDDDDV